jgi:hypothetical protein
VRGFFGAALEIVGGIGSTLISVPIFIVPTDENGHIMLPGMRREYHTA